MIRYIGYVCLALISSAILSVTGLLAWFIADREVPVQVLATEVLTPVVRPGGRLAIKQTLQVTRACRGHYDRVLYDSTNHRQFLPDVDYESPPRGLGTFEVVTEETVPDFFMPGEAQYRALPLFSCNPLQAWYWPIMRGETVIRFRIEAGPK